MINEMPSKKTKNRIDLRMAQSLILPKTRGPLLARGLGKANPAAIS
jgi:hypothetical protein